MTMLHVASTDPNRLVRYKAAEWIGAHTEELLLQRDSISDDPARAQALSAVQKILEARGIRPAEEIETEGH